MSNIIKKWALLAINTICWLGLSFGLGYTVGYFLGDGWNTYVLAFLTGALVGIPLAILNVKICEKYDK